MLKIARKGVVVALLAGGALALAGCTLGKSGNHNGSIYNGPPDNGSAGGGSSGAKTAGQ